MASRALAALYEAGFATFHIHFSGLQDMYLCCMAEYSLVNLRAPADKLPHFNRFMYLGERQSSGSLYSSHWGRDTRGKTTLRAEPWWQWPSDFISQAGSDWQRRTG